MHPYLIDMEDIKINFHDYYYNCGEGCCTNYGVITTINGVELRAHNTDYVTIVQQILEHLGYKVEISISEDYR